MRLINFEKVARALALLAFILLFGFAYQLGYKASRTGDTCIVKLSHQYYDTHYIGHYDVSDGRLACRIDMAKKGADVQ